MSTAVNKEKVKVFETILSSPGMNEKCKVVLQLSRRNVLLLSRLIEAGLLSKDSMVQDSIILAFPKEAGDDFKLIHEEILKKAELADFYQQLNSFL